MPVNPATWEWDDDMPIETTASEEVRPGDNHTAEDYTAWLARGKSLAAEQNNRNWLLGDWLNEGDDEYNYKNLGIPNYLLIGSHPPNFWKDVSDETDLAVGTLKNLALVARRFPVSKRIATLSWSHHMIAAPFERRFEYLLACKPEDEKPYGVEWLRAHIEEVEEGPEHRERCTVPLRLPVDLIRKLKDVAKHKGQSLDKILHSACARAVTEYLQEQEREISLNLFDAYTEGMWPFSPAAAKEYTGTKRKRRAA